jgi:hypothetical protein
MNPDTFIYLGIYLKLMSALLDKVVAVSIGLFVAAIMLPLALVTMANANLTGVDATIVTVVTILLPVLAVVGIALYFINRG